METIADIIKNGENSPSMPQKILKHPSQLICSERQKRSYPICAELLELVGKMQSVDLTIL
eukprot:12266429-Ditylum_brightwellii.AAC.1